MGSRTQVAIIDDRALLASGLRASLSGFRRIEVTDADHLRPGGFVILGHCAEPYEPPAGIRVLHLDTERSVVELVRMLLSDSLPSRRTKQGRALSEREQLILSMTADGSSAAEIARRLGVSARTVERNRSTVTEKLAVRSSSHAVAVGARGGDDTRRGT